MVLGTCLDQSGTNRRIRDFQITSTSSRKIRSEDPSYCCNYDAGGSQPAGSLLVHRKAGILKTSYRGSDRCLHRSCPLLSGSGFFLSGLRILFGSWMLGEDSRRALEN